MKQLQIISVDDRLKQLTLNMMLVIFWYDDHLQTLKEINDDFIYFASSEIRYQLHMKTCIDNKLI